MICQAIVLAKGFFDPRARRCSKAAQPGSLFCWNHSFLAEHIDRIEWKETARE